LAIGEARFLDGRRYLIPLETNTEECVENVTRNRERGDVSLWAHPLRRMHRLQEIETVVLVESLVVRTTTPRPQRPRFHTIMCQDRGSLFDRGRLSVINVIPNQLADLFGSEANPSGKQS
jgi:hypothetical protein